ncbi:MAG: phospholipase A [Sphingomonas sp.]
MRVLLLYAGAAILAFAAPAAAQLRPLVEPPASAEAAKQGVDVYLINDGTRPATQAPARIETRAADGTQLTLTAVAADPVTVQPGAFAKVRYRQLIETAAAAPAGALKTETITADSSGSSAFLDRLRPHEPIYGAFGTGDAGGKLQLSFAFRALGRADGPNLNFAYTQTMFWALEKPSGPFRTTNYSPELFVDIPFDRTTLLGFGYRHDSNGGGVTDSIDINRAFFRASKRLALGDGWDLDLTPQAWFYFGEHGVADDISRYWGYTSLTAAIGRPDSFKFAITGRGNPGTGKGSAEVFLSYPLSAIWDGLPHVYLFGEAFTGYGEALSDYKRSATHGRLGIAFTR